jgi:hypothetical protein
MGPAQLIGIHKKKIHFLQQEFKSCFQNVRKYDKRAILFSVPFDVNFEGVLAEFQIQIIDTKCDAELITKHRHGRLIHFQAIVYLLLKSFQCLAITRKGRKLPSQVNICVNSCFVK